MEKKTEINRFEDLEIWKEGMRICDDFKNIFSKLVLLSSMISNFIKTRKTNF